MDQETLTAALLASYEARPDLVPLDDEDFKEDPEGDWIKLEGGYTTTSLRRATLMWLYLGMYASDEDKKKYQEGCEKIDQMTKYTMVTTMDQRKLRYARKRAQEIVSTEDTLPQ